MPGNNFLKSVLRTLDILEIVGSSNEGMLLMGLQLMVGQKASALHTLLRTMTRRGFLIKLDHPPRYVLGPRALSFNCSLQLERLITLAAPIMMNISRQAHVQTLLQKHAASTVIVLRRICPETPLFVEPANWIGHPYGTGIIFQAYQNRQEQDDFWSYNPMDELARTIWGNHENLRQFLRGVPKWRLAVISPKFDGKIRMSAPILDADGKPVAAISCIQSVKGLKPQDITLATRLIHQAGRMLSADASQNVRSARRKIVHSVEAAARLERPAYCYS